MATETSETSGLVIAAIALGSLALGGLALALAAKPSAGPGPAPCTSPCPCPCPAGTVCQTSSGTCQPVVPASGCLQNCVALGLVCNSTTGICQKQATTCTNNPSACPPGAYCLSATGVCSNPQPCTPPCTGGATCDSSGCTGSFNGPGCGACIGGPPPAGGCPCAIPGHCLNGCAPDDCSCLTGPPPPAWDVWQVGDMFWDFDENVNPVPSQGAPVNGTITFTYQGPGGPILIGFTATDQAFFANCGTLSFPSQVAFDLAQVSVPTQVTIGTFQLAWPGCLFCTYGQSLLGGEQFVVTPYVVAGGQTWWGQAQSGALGLSC